MTSHHTRRKSTRSLDELTDALAELSPMTPGVPFYSSTMYDPRDELECDAWYWADNLRHTVRFAASVQAALEDGYRVFAELAPHPLLTHAAEQTADSLGIPLAALPAMRREQELPHGLAGFLTDLYSAGAAIDFSVLNADGRLVDAPLPTWSNRPLLLDRGGQQSQSHGGYTVAVHPLMGAHVQLQEEPERHVWQGEVGTATQPWLSDHRMHDAAALPEATYCEMALTAARTVLGDASELSDIRIDRTLMLDEETPLGAVASLQEPGVLTFAVETLNDGKHTRWATAVLRAVEDADQPPAVEIADLLATHPRRVDGAEVRQCSTAWTSIRSRLHRPDRVHTAERTDGRCWPRSSCRARSVRSRPAMSCTRRCCPPVSSRWKLTPSVQEQVANAGLLLPRSVRRLRAYGSARNARYCLTRVTRADAAGIGADLDILDEHGAVLLTVRGLESVSRHRGERDRVLNERLLTIDWEQRTCPRLDRAGPEHGC